MKLKNRLLMIVASLITTLSAVAAHSEQNQSYYGSGMMWSDGGGWMHNGAHMMGYNMWGMHWFGLIPGLIFWALAILGVFYLYRKFSETGGEE